MKPKITRRRWTTDEIEFIKSNAHKMSNYDIASTLGRTPMAIYEMRGRLKMERGTMPKKDRNVVPNAIKPSSDKVKLVQKFSLFWGLVTVEKPL